MINNKDLQMLPKSETLDITMSPDDAYQMIDYFLRNNLNGDDDYKNYSDALEVISNSSVLQPIKPLTDKQLEDIAVGDEFVLSCDVDDFIQIARAVEQAHRVIAKKLNEGL